MKYKLERPFWDGEAYHARGAVVELEKGVAPSTAVPLTKDAPVGDPVRMPPPVEPLAVGRGEGEPLSPSVQAEGRLGRDWKEEMEATGVLTGAPTPPFERRDEADTLAERKAGAAAVVKGEAKQPDAPLPDPPMAKQIKK